MNVKAPKLGLRKNNCKKHNLAKCEECDHTQFVEYKLPSYSGNPRYLLPLITGILKSQETFILEMCKFEQDICQQGDTLNFPCMQCKELCDSVLCVCGEIECNGTYYEGKHCDLSIGGESDCLICSFSQIDFTSTPELIAIYEKIINAIKTFTGGANWLGIEEFCKAIYGDQCSMIKFEGGIYYVDIGRSMADAEIKSADFIPFPTPPDSKIKLLEVI